MSCFHPKRYGWVFGCFFMLAMFALRGEAHEHDEFRYCYVPFNDVPAGFSVFDPVVLDNKDRVFGTIYDESFFPFVAVYKDGNFTVGQPGIVYAANEHGTIGGSVLIDPVNFIEQAALFRGNRVKLIPPQLGEFTSFVSQLNDWGTALVVSLDSTTFDSTHLLFRHGQARPLDFGLTVTNPMFLRINNQGVIAGTQGITPFNGATGFRFDTRTNETTLLEPFPTEPLAWALGINNRGYVLGYSFVSGGIERIGIWDPRGKFKTYFLEGTPEFPTISNRLIFNNNNLIVITYVSSPASERFKNSYLVPKPGVRLNLADLVENLPDGASLGFIQDLNDRGNLIGFGSLGSFLLERIEKYHLKLKSCTMPITATQALSGVTDMQTASPLAVAMLDRHVPPAHALKSGFALLQNLVENPLLRP